MIYRKLKDYIHVNDSNVTHIFGTLNSTNCVWQYQTDTGYKSYQSTGVDYGQYDFLLEYYVMGMFPSFVIEGNSIMPILIITLDKEAPKI